MARAKPEEKRTTILETAKALFALEGMNVSMNDIARKIGIPVGSIYTYFPSKQALIETIIEEGWNQFRTWLEQQLAMIENNCDDNAQGDERTHAFRALAFLVNNALPTLFGDVELIMILLSEARASAKLEQKLQYLSSLIAQLVALCYPSGNDVQEDKLLHTGITVLLLGALETLRISAQTDLNVSAEDIKVFLKQIVQDALGQALPDTD